MRGEGPRTGRSVAAQASQLEPRPRTRQPRRSAAVRPGSGSPRPTALARASWPAVASVAPSRENSIGRKRFPSWPSSGWPTLPALGRPELARAFVVAGGEQAAVGGERHRSAPARGAESCTPRRPADAGPGPVRLHDRDDGLPPWDVVQQGLSRTFGLGIGTSSVLISFVVLLGWWPLRERLGIGTLANAIVVGPGDRCRAVAL